MGGRASTRRRGASCRARCTCWGSPAQPLSHRRPARARTRGAAEAAQLKFGGDLEGQQPVLLNKVQRHLAKRLVPHHHLGAAVCGGKTEGGAAARSGAWLGKTLRQQAWYRPCLPPSHPVPCTHPPAMLLMISSMRASSPRLYPSSSSALRISTVPCSGGGGRGSARGGGGRRRPRRQHCAPHAAHRRRVHQHCAPPCLTLVSVELVSTPCANTATFASATFCTAPSGPRFSTMPLTTCESCRPPPVAGAGRRAGAAKHGPGVGGTGRTGARCMRAQQSSRPRWAPGLCITAGQARTVDLHHAHVVHVEVVRVLGHHIDARLCAQARRGGREEEQF